MLMSEKMKEVGECAMQKDEEKQKGNGAELADRELRLLQTKNDELWCVAYLVPLRCYY